MHETDVAESSKEFYDTIITCGETMERTVRAGTVELSEPVEHHISSGGVLKLHTPSADQYQLTQFI